MSEKQSYEHYIITESGNISLLVRLRDIVLTVALWVIYIYFIREALPFASDFYDWAKSGFDDYTRYSDLDIIPSMQAYGKVAGFMAAVYIGWALYNRFRFRGRQRRKPRAIVAPEDLATMYGFSPETVVSWQEASSMVMHHDEHGHLTDVKIVR